MMRVEHIGEGEPELAILGAVHGDELCGVHAISTLLDEDPDVQRPIKCIIANEPAVEQHVRYIDTDLNRVFPGDPAAETFEPRLAHRLLAELEGCTTLSMHSTQSDGRPFGERLLCAYATWIAESLGIDILGTTISEEVKRCTEFTTDHGLAQPLTDRFCSGSVCPHPGCEMKTPVLVDTAALVPPIDHCLRCLRPVTLSIHYLLHKAQ